MALYRYSRWSWPTSAALVLALTPSHPVRAAEVTAIDHCGYRIEDSGLYALQADLRGCSGPGIIVDAPDVVLQLVASDGFPYNVYAAAGNTADGLQVTANGTGAQVMGGSFWDFGHAGIDVAASAVTITGAAVGAGLVGGGGLAGGVIVDSADVALTNVAALLTTGPGFQLAGGPNITCTGCLSKETGAEGFSISAPNTLLEDPEVDLTCTPHAFVCTAAGIRLHGAATGTVIDDAFVDYSNGDGIVVDANAATVRGSRLYSNAAAGIVVSGGVADARVMNNIVEQRDRSWDFEDDNPGCGSDVWVGNLLGRTSPSNCIH